MHYLYLIDEQGCKQWNIELYGIILIDDLDLVTISQDYFTEASLCQDELEQVSELTERLMPTLDTNDSATLEQSLAGVQRKYGQVMAGAHSRQGHLEQKLKQWNAFQVSREFLLLC